MAATGPLPRSSPRRVDPWQCRSEKEKKAPGEKLPALTPVPDGVEFGQRHEPVNTNSPQAESRTGKYA